MKTIAEQLNIKDFPFIIKDKNGKVIYKEYSKGYWEKFKLDKNDYVLYFENSVGYITDNRVKEMTIAEIEKALNIKNLKIVK